MLPVLEAIAFDNQITEHTRTQPWIVITKDNMDTLEPFVVKLFTNEENSNRFAIAKEVFSNVMAREFNLSCPEAAFIDFYSNNFTSTLDDWQLQSLNTRDHRAKFAVKYLAGHNQYNTNYPRKFFHKFVGVDSIYAFDNLIQNNDRNIGKANVLLVENRIFLIDHEYALDINPEIISEYDVNNWSYQCTKHIFYNYLLDTYRSDFFSDFQDRLGHFNPDMLDPYRDQLQQLQYDPPYVNYQLLKDYLHLIQRNPGKFVTIIKKKIQ